MGASESKLLFSSCFSKLLDPKVRIQEVSTQADPGNHLDYAVE